MPDRKSPRRPRSRAKRPGTADPIIAMHELLVGESLAEAKAALDEEGVDVAAAARAMVARAQAKLDELRPPSQAGAGLEPSPRRAQWSDIDALSHGPGAGALRAAAARQGLSVAWISGHSMNAAGLRDGDAVYYLPRRSAEDGDIALVWLGGARLVGRIRMSGGEPASLESANPAFAAIDLRGADFRVRGVAVVGQGPRLH